MLWYFTGSYLIVITKKRKVGEFFNHAVWKATDFDIISYKKTILHLTDIQVEVDFFIAKMPFAAFYCMEVFFSDLLYLWFFQ